MTTHLALWIDWHTYEEAKEFNEWKESFPCEISLEKTHIDVYIRDKDGTIIDLIPDSDDYIKLPLDIPEKYLTMLLLKWG